MSREDELIESIKDNDIVYIYGAGFIGKLLYKRIAMRGVDTNKVVFLVSESTNIRTLFSRPVTTVFEEKPNEGVIIIATMGNLQEELKLNLIKVGCKLPVIALDENLINELKNNQMSLAQIPIYISKIDVLLIVSDNYEGSGAFLSAVGLCEQMYKAGICMVMILPEYGEGEEILKNKKILYLYVPSKNWCVDKNESRTLLYDNFDAREKIKEIIKKYNVKLVHNNTSYTYVGAEVALEMDIPYVWHLRECIYYQGKKFIDEEYAENLICRADRVICVSEFQEKAYPFLNDANVSVVYNGIKCEDYTHKKNQPFFSPTISIICVGGINELKGQEDIIRAAVILKRAGLDFIIRFVGRGDEEYLDRLKRIINENNLDGNIYFWGYTDNVAKYYEMSDISINSSRGEAFGRVTIEAMRSGCLVIGADAGATSELITDGVDGYLYKPGDAEHLANIILNASENINVTKQVINRGQERGNQFTVENNMRNIKAIYEDILTKRGWI